MALYHFFEAITNTRGDSLPDYRVIARQPNGGPIQPIYADLSGTPIASVSGIPNTALTDDAGNVSFFVDVPGTYDFEYSTPDGVFVSATRQVPLIGGIVGPEGPQGPQGLPGIGPMGVTPEAFGAKGDGVTNDTAAFAALSTYIAQRGGGVIELSPGATYIVGAQTYQAGVPVAGGLGGNTYTAYAPISNAIMSFIGLPRGVIIRMNGARMLAAAGLRYGTWSTTTPATPTNHGSGYVGPESSTAYEAMIHIENCGGMSRVYDGELDGNCEAMSWGGPAGDTGWQITCVGILAQFNADFETSGVYSHHHCQDGIEVAANPSQRLVVSGKFDHNCRLGANLRSGAGVVFRDGSSDYNGKGSHFSAPAAGIDLEAETGPIRNVTVSNWSSRHNQYTGLVSDTGDVRGCEVTNSILWAGQNEGGSLYISRPDFKFTKCVIGGSFSLFRADPSSPFTSFPSFEECLFTDIPAGWSLDGTANTAQAQLNFGDGLDTATSYMFRRCTFQYIQTRLITGPKGLGYDNCLLDESKAYPAGQGTFITGSFRNNCVIRTKAGYVNAGGGTVFADETTNLSTDAGSTYALQPKSIGTVQAAYQSPASPLTAGVASNAAGATPTQAEFNALVAIVNAMRGDDAAIRATVNGEITALVAANAQRSA